MTRDSTPLIESRPEREIAAARCVESTIRVRYAETDQMGVAYHANHLIWFEVGRTDYCRGCGFTYADMERESGTRMMVVEVRCRYRASALYDQELLVLTWVKSLRRRMLTFGYRLVRLPERALVAEGESVHLVTDRNGKPCSIPQKYLELLQER